MYPGHRVAADKFLGSPQTRSCDMMSKTPNEDVVRKFLNSKSNAECFWPGKVSSLDVIAKELQFPDKGQAREEIIFASRRFSSLSLQGNTSAKSSQTPSFKIYLGELTPRSVRR